MPCAHCKTHENACVYEKRDQRTKSSLRNELDTLRRDLHASEAVIDALRHSQHGDLIVEQLRAGASNCEIVDIVQALRVEGNATVPVAAAGRAPVPDDATPSVPYWDPLLVWPGSELLSMDMGATGLPVDGESAFGGIWGT